MMDIIKGQNQTEIKKERVIKLHRLIIETNEKILKLLIMLETARQEQAAEMINSLESGIPLNKKGKNLVREIQLDVEDQQQLLVGLAQRKKLAIQEYYDSEYADRLSKRKNLEKEADNLNKKMIELHKEIKRLEALHQPIYNSLISTQNPQTFERTYFGRDGQQIEDLILDDPFIPFTPQEWAGICSEARCQNLQEIRVDQNGNIIRSE